VDNNILKIRLHKIKQKVKLQEECHKQETLELNKNLIGLCVRKENEQLILEIILTDEKLRQSSKEAEKLRKEVSFLQQKMQPCDTPAQIEHNIAVGEFPESCYVWPCSKPVDIYRGPVIAEVKPAVRPQ
jgi:hypothetical protein